MLNNFICIFFSLMTPLCNYLYPKYLGTDIGSISNKYNLQITPASWTFLIWLAIYSSLILSNITKIFLKEKYSNNFVINYFATCVLNILWIYFFTNNYIIYSAGCLIVLCISLFTLFNNDSNNKLDKNIISGYLSWCCGASLLNIGIFLLKNYILSQNSISITFIVLFSVIQILWQFYINYKKEKLSSLLFILVSIWASFGIFFNKEKYKYSYILFVVTGVCLMFQVLCVKQKKERIKSDIEENLLEHN